MRGRVLVVPVAVLLIFAGGCASEQKMLSRAENAVRSGNYEKAEEISSSILSSDPSNNEADIILSYAKYGDNMLHAALWERDLAALEYIATIIPDINSVEERFNAPVIVLAAAWGVTDAVRILLEAGADPNAGNDNQGQSALMWAVKSHENRMEMFELLLDSGANVNIRSDLGETPLSLARRYDNREMEKMLLERGAR